MARQPVGEARTLVRQLAHRPTPELVRRINRQYPPEFVASILGALSLEQRKAHGLSIERGRLVLTVVENGYVPVAAQELGPVTLVDRARALTKARRPADLEVVNGSSLYAVAYDNPVKPDAVRRVWNKATTAADRIGVLRRAMSVRVAEVSSLAHNGAYDQLHGNEGESGLTRHAGKLVVSIKAPVPHNKRIRWGYQATAAEVRHTLQPMSMANDGEQPFPVLVESQTFGQAEEIGAVLGDFNRDDVSYRSPGRCFTLRNHTVFAIDPDLATELAGGEAIPINAPLAVTGDAAQLAQDFLDMEDASILAPAYTNFIIEQQLVAA